MADILLVEDNDINRALITRILERDGHTVREASDGESGVTIFEEWDPDLVITDLFMPNVNGLETIRRIRDIRPHAKIIAISGGGPDRLLGNLDIAKELGAVTTVDKPFLPPEFLRVVNDVLKESTDG